MPTELKVSDPWFIEDPQIHELHAVKQLAFGQADPEQQIKAFDYIIQKLGLFQAVGWIPGKPDETSFLNGRQYVAKTMLTIKDTNITELTRKLEDARARAAASPRTAVRRSG